MHGPWSLQRSFTEPYQVLLRGLLTTSYQWKVIDTTIEGPGGVRGFLCRSGETFIDRNSPPPPQKEYGGVDFYCAVHGERNRARGQGEWKDDVFL